MKAIQFYRISTLFIFTLLTVTMFLSCEEDNTPPPPGDDYETLNKQGYLIHGLKDKGGIEKNLLLINHSFMRMNEHLPELEKFRELGFHEDLRSLMELDILNNFEIEIVDLIPWVDTGSKDHPLEEFFHDNPLAPSFPTRNSLVANPDQVQFGSSSLDGVDYFYIDTQHRDADGAMQQETVHYGTDGSTQYIKSVYDANGNLIYRTRQTYDKNGNLIWQDDPTDQPEDDRSSPPPNPFGDGEDREEIADGGDGSGEDSGSEGEGGDEGEEGEEGEGIASFQPADGESVFCPMTIEYCRRAAQKMLEDSSPEKIKLGFVRINPGDPDTDVPGPRLKYDPKDFVINPSPDEITEGGTSKPVDGFIIPVLINPPGPNEGRIEN